MRCDCRHSWIWWIDRNICMSVLRLISQIFRVYWKCYTYLVIINWYLLPMFYIFQFTTLFDLFLFYLNFSRASNNSSNKSKSNSNSSMCWMNNFTLDCFPTNRVYMFDNININGHISPIILCYCHYKFVVGLVICWCIID